MDHKAIPGDGVLVRQPPHLGVRTTAAAADDISLSAFVAGPVPFEYESQTYIGAPRLHLPPPAGNSLSVALSAHVFFLREPCC